MSREDWKARKLYQDALIRRVFLTPDGEQLLRMLNNEYVYSPILSNENNVVFRRLGKQELVLLFNEATRGTPNE
jgi:hypothetical protein